MNESFGQRSPEEQGKKSTRRDFLKKALNTTALLSLLSRDVNNPTTQKVDPPRLKKETRQSERIQAPESIIIPEKILVGPTQKQIFNKDYYEEHFEVCFQLKNSESIKVFFTFGDKLKKNNINDGRMLHQILQKAKPREINLSIKDNGIIRVLLKEEIIWSLNEN